MAESERGYINPPPAPGPRAVERLMAAATSVEIAIGHLERLQRKLGIKGEAVTAAPKPTQPVIEAMPHFLALERLADKFVQQAADLDRRVQEIETLF